MVEILDIDLQLQLFPSKKIQKLLKQQITQLALMDVKVLSSILFEYDKLKIYLQFESDKFLKNPQKVTQKLLSFVIFIRLSFPISGPSTHCNTDFIRPTIRDLRDITEDILGKKYQFKIRLKEIVEKIPQFILKVQQMNQKYLSLQKIGKYYLNSIFYKIQTSHFYKQKYTAFQIDKKNKDKIYMREIILTQCQILIFTCYQHPKILKGKLNVPQQDQLRRCCLFLYADYQALAQIMRSNQQNSQICLRFKNYQQDNNFTLISKKYKVINCASMIKKILKKITQFQPVKLDYKNQMIENKNIQINNDEMTIQNALKLCMILQQEIISKFNKQNLNNLNNIYQYIVEYYSAQSDPIYLVYVHKINQLFSRQDVQIIMKYKQ